MTAADDEMREALAEIMGGHRPNPWALTIADRVLAELRRRGVFFPGDPVTDAMCEAAHRAYRYEPPNDSMRAAITAALAQRSPQGDEARKP